MRMKRWILLAALVLALALPAACAEVAAAPAALTPQELFAWTDELFTQALVLQPPVTQQEEQNEFAVELTGYTLYIDSATLSADSQLKEAYATQVGSTCPRGLMVGGSLEALLAAYPNDNPGMVGTYNNAVLFVDDSQSECVSVGWVERTGQRVSLVEYCLFIQNQAGYQYCGLVYAIEDGVIAGVRAFGLSDIISQEQMRQQLDWFSQAQEAEEYFAYPTSSVGTDLPAFDREDLTFGGMDFLDATPERALAALGPCADESWVEDSTGELLRVMRWSDLEWTFVYDADKQFLSTDMVCIYGNGFEGPRGALIGDTLSAVMCRFRHSDGFYDEASGREILYGDELGTQPPFGIAEYGDDGQATVWYAMALDGEYYMCVFNFLNTRLAETIVCRWTEE